MKPRKILENIYWVGAVDWERRLFDSLIPLPDGTSYNAYYVKGAEKTALFDAVDPTQADLLLNYLKQFPAPDYLISHHAEQDHSGAIPHVLAAYPNTQVITSQKGKTALIKHLNLPEKRITIVEDGQTLDLGGKTLEFIYTPWVHWPETMTTYLREDKILFSCDFFGSHLATAELYASQSTVYEPAKRYYAEIMMPFRVIIDKHLSKLESYNIEMIAPSHGPIYNNPKFIVDCYKEWVSGKPKNHALVVYVSMHGSTKTMAHYLVAELVERGVSIELFDATTTDLGKIAMSLVDCATLIIATPTVLGGAHPNVVSTAYLANALKPKLKNVGIIGSYGWGSKVETQLKSLLAGLQVNVMETVLSHGLPSEDEFKALEQLADAIADKHKADGLV